MESDHAADASSPSRRSRHDRLDRHDRRRDRDRAVRQGLHRQSVPDPVVVDGEHPALRLPRHRLRGKRSDRVLANRFLYHLRDPRRGEIVVFNTPPEAAVKCGAGGTYVKRLIGLPGDTVEVRLVNNLGYVFINGKQLDEPYIENARRGSQPFAAAQGPAGAVLHDGRQPLRLVRFASVGHGAAFRPDRQGLRHLLAAARIRCTDALRSIERDPRRTQIPKAPAASERPRAVPLHSAAGRRPVLSHEHHHPEHRAGAVARRSRSSRPATPSASTSR